MALYTDYCNYQRSSALPWYCFVHCHHDDGGGDDDDHVVINGSCFPGRPVSLVSPFPRELHPGSSLATTATVTPAVRRTGRSRGSNSVAGIRPTTSKLRWKCGSSRDGCLPVISLSWNSKVITMFWLSFPLPWQCRLSRFWLLSPSLVKPDRTRPSPLFSVI